MRTFILVFYICRNNFFFFQNGSLLRKHTYLSNGSSYSVSSEDGVDILLLDSDSGIDKTSIEYMDESSDTTATSSDLPSKLQSFTFEAQVVSSLCSL